MACNCHQTDPRLDSVVGALQSNATAFRDLMGQVQLKAPTLHAQLKPHVAPLLKEQDGIIEQCKAMGGHYEGAFTAKELAGVIWLPNTQFAAIEVKAGTVGDVLGLMGQDATKITVFNLGKGESGTNYGITGSLTERDTSFLKGGDLPQGWLFDCKGFEVHVRTLDGTPLAQADMQVIGDWRMRYTEEGETRAVRLGELRRMPPAHRLEVFGDNEQACGQFTGPLYRSPTTIFRIRGGAQEKRAIELHVDPKAKTVADMRITIMAVGLEGQRPQVT